MSVLGLGSVQFGEAYGVTNFAGKVKETEVDEILVNARKSGISLLDTASMYGASEAVLGRCGIQDFQVVTKTPRFDVGVIEKKHEDMIKVAFESSLEKLRVSRVYGLLLHHAADLFSSNGERLLSVLRGFRDEGLVENIGVSIYHEVDVYLLLARYRDINIVQAPVNVLDQRLITGGHIERLAQSGIKVHARSPFLQGLLLIESEKMLPSSLSRLRPFIRRWRSSLKESFLSPAEGAIGFLKSVCGVDAIIAGVTTLAELDELVKAFASAPNFLKFDLACDDPSLIDPSQWGSL